MSLSEFELINSFFNVKTAVEYPADISIGDDCAVVDVPEGKQLAITSDTLVEGVHFLAASKAKLLGHKVLAVNLSDLAAMGATPAWVSLAITMPTADQHWLADFSQGFLALAEQYGVQLVGGDTTRGPLSITVTAFGLLPQGQRLTRAGAQIGDNIYITGVIGSAGLGLWLAQQEGVAASNQDLLHYLSPQPCVSIGQKILAIASSCIDISDGLSADLSHILKASQVGALIEDAKLPLSEGVKNHLNTAQNWQWPYTTGDDYQLCFTCPEENEAVLSQLLAGQSYTKIGKIDSQPGLRVLSKAGEIVTLNKGYQHF